MRNTFRVALAVLILSGSTVRADVKGPDSIADRVARASVVVVGKVTRIEEKTILAKPYANATEKVEFRVAVVQIEETLGSAKGAKELRVGFMPAGRRRYIAPLEAGQEVCLFLRPAPDGGFLTYGMYDALLKTTPTFAKDVETARHCATLLAKTEDNLKSSNAADRYLTAAMLIIRARTPDYTQPKQQTEPLPAEQSRLILEALAAADWNIAPYAATPDLHPRTIFQRLGLTNADGWTIPGQLKDFEPAAKTWLKANSDKYRIQRFLAQDPSK